MSLEVEPKPHGNNPYANRFDNLPSKAQGRFLVWLMCCKAVDLWEPINLVWLKGFLKPGYEPDWIAATSIGAIQAAIIVGNPPEKRIEKLERFWDEIAPVIFSIF